jgi:hypothetical protein
LILLDNVSSAETFKAELWKCRHVTMTTLDWYREYAAARERSRLAVSAPIGP